MKQLIFFAITGALALLALEPDSLYLFYAMSAVIGPLAIPLSFLWIALPRLWFAAASFAAINAVAKRWIARPQPRYAVSALGVVFLGWALFWAIPELNVAHTAHRVEQILASDVAPPAPFAPVRSLEIRQDGALFGPGGCYDLCIDLLAAGVLDRVTLRTQNTAAVFSREQVTEGCKSNLFDRKHQGRAFRLALAGVCLVTTPLLADANPDQADVTVEFLDDWAEPAFQLRQVRAVDRAGKILFQRSTLAWQEPDLNIGFGDHLPSLAKPALLHKTAGAPQMPFDWPAIAGLLGLPQTGLRDSALTLPPGTDPARFDPPDVSFRMLERIAQKGALTDAELVVFVTMMLQPGFRPSAQTPAALRALLTTAPQHGPAIAQAVEAHVLDLIARDGLYPDDDLAQTLITLREMVPAASLPPVLRQLSALQLQDRWGMGQHFAIAATAAGADPTLYLPWALARAEREAVNFQTAASHPFVVAVSMPDLNRAICQHAQALAPQAAVWLSWVTHHAAVVGADRTQAVGLGVTAARLGLSPDQIATGFAGIAGWTGADLDALRQAAVAPCPG